MFLFFCGECQRTPRVGRRRRVDESRAAGKPRRANFATTTMRTKKKKKKRSGRALACSRISLYILLLQPTRVAACLVAVPGSTFLRRGRLSRSPPFPLFSLLRIFFSFFLLRIIATMARKQTHNPLVTHRRYNSKYTSVRRSNFLTKNTGGMAEMVFFAFGNLFIENKVYLFNSRQS